MNLLDTHAERLPLIVSRYGRPVTLTDPDGPTDYENVMMIWNDVEHALKIGGLSDKPMGAKYSLYVDEDSLFNLSINPVEGWKATGSPNKYEDEKTYILQIPKIDKQLPGKLFFISEEDLDTISMPAPETQ